MPPYPTPGGDGGNRGRDPRRAAAPARTAPLGDVALTTGHSAAPSGAGQPDDGSGWARR